MAASLASRLTWAGVMTVCVLVAGCVQPGAGKHEVHLIASARPYEPDLPIPAGCRLVDDAAEDRSTGVSRLYLRHLYVGKADKYAVRNFYRDQMPPLRWVLVSDGNVRGTCTMRFEKGTESCTIQIRDAERGQSGYAEIQMLVSQEQRGSGTADARATRNSP